MWFGMERLRAWGNGGKKKRNRDGWKYTVLSRHACSHALSCYTRYLVNCGATTRGLFFTGKRERTEICGEFHVIRKIADWSNALQISNQYTHVSDRERKSLPIGRRQVIPAGRPIDVLTASRRYLHKERGDLSRSESFHDDVRFFFSDRRAETWRVCPSWIDGRFCRH